MEELRIIKAKYEERDAEGRAIKPKFFGHVARKKGYYDSKKKNYKMHKAPMDFVQHRVDMSKRGKNGKRASEDWLSIGQILNDVGIDGIPDESLVALVLAMVRDMSNKTRKLYMVSSDVTINSEERRRLASSYFEKCVNGINSLNMNQATMRKLLLEVDSEENKDIKRKLWSILFGMINGQANTTFMDLLKAAQEPIYTLEECEFGNEDVKVFGFPYRYTLVA